jgi:hypothetical protein
MMSQPEATMQYMRRVVELLAKHGLTRYYELHGYLQHIPAQAWVQTDLSSLAPARELRLVAGVLAEFRPGPLLNNASVQGLLVAIQAQVAASPPVIIPRRVA